MAHFSPPRPRGRLALATLLALIPLPAAAQIPLTALSLTARSYDHVDSWEERGFRPARVVEVIQIPGELLVEIRAVFDGPWSDEVDQLRVNAGDIALVLPDGTELEAIGGYPYWGQFSTASRGISARRPRNFPDEDAEAHWNSVFRVPKGVASATLRITGDGARFEQSLSIPGPTAADDPASFARFAISGVRRYRRADLEEGNGANTAYSSITAPPGMVLAEVEIEVTGLAPNTVDGAERFNWRTSDFRLIDAQGNSLGLVGEGFMRRLLDWQFNGVNIGDNAERKVVWLVPEGLGEARLLFGETEVATVPLGAAPIADTN